MTDSKQKIISMLMEHAEKGGYHLSEKQAERILDKATKNLWNRHSNRVYSLIFLFLFIWIGLSQLVFRIQNPWMTETQMFLHLPEAFTFQKVEPK